LLGGRPRVRDEHRERHARRLDLFGRGSEEFLPEGLHLPPDVLNYRLGKPGQVNRLGNRFRGGFGSHTARIPWNEGEGQQKPSRAADVSPCTGAARHYAAPAVLPGRTYETLPCRDRGRGVPLPAGVPPDLSLGNPRSKGASPWTAGRS